MTKSNKEIQYKIELVLNKNLFEKQIITEDIYKQANEQLLNLITKCKNKKETTGDSG